MIQVALQNLGEKAQLGLIKEEKLSEPSKKGFQDEKQTEKETTYAKGEFQSQKIMLWYTLIHVICVCTVIIDFLGIQKFACF